MHGGHKRNDCKAMKYFNKKPISDRYPKKFIVNQQRANGHEAPKLGRSFKVAALPKDYLIHMAPQNNANPHAKTHCNLTFGASFSLRTIKDMHKRYQGIVATRTFEVKIEWYSHQCEYNDKFLQTVGAQKFSTKVVLDAKSL